ncbi:hypothetical protein D7151_06255 [Vibrio cholerae]|nr:hypothetical protein [Vibrio cholerae]
MGFFNTVINAATTVASAIAKSFITPHSNSNILHDHPLNTDGSGFNKVFETGPIEWGFSGGKLVVYNTSNEDYVITFTRTGMEPVTGENIAKSSVLLVGGTDKNDPTEEIDEYDTANSQITTTPADVDVAHYSNTVLRSSQAIKKVSYSIARLPFNVVIQITDQVKTKLTNKDGKPGLEFIAPESTPHFATNIQASNSNGLVFANGDSGKTGTVSFFVPFPDGTEFLSGFAESLFVELAFDKEHEEIMLSSAKKSIPVLA